MDAAGGAASDGAAAGGAAAGGTEAGGAEASSATSGAAGGDAASGDAGYHLSAVVFDFDSTLSMPQFIKRCEDYAVADRLELCLGLSQEEILANFGGAGRVARLRQLLQTLASRGVALSIVSLGFTPVIRRHLDAVGLGEFFPPAVVFGQDSRRLQDVDYQKAMLIRRLLDESHVAPRDALFVDDSRSHIALCRKLKVCDCLHVAGNGMSDAEMRAIEAKAVGSQAQPGAAGEAEAPGGP